MAAIPSVATLGIVLNTFMDQLSQIIDDAKNAGIAVDLQVAQSIMLCLDHFANVYKDSVHITIDKLQGSILKDYELVKSLMQDLEKGVSSSVDTILNKSQQICNTLPFRHAEPQLTSSMNSVTWSNVTDDEKHHQVMLRGNFLNLASAPNGNHVPSLTFSSTSAQLVSCSSNIMEFNVPVDTLFKHDSTKVQTMTGILSIPWYQDGFIPGVEFLKHLKVDIFHVQLCCWPKSPGIFRITVDIRRTLVRSRDMSSQSFHLASTREAGNDDHKGERRSVFPTAGWKIDTTKPISVPFIHQGDIEAPHIVSQDQNQITFQFGTIHHSVGSSGSIDCSVKFTEYQQYTQDEHPIYQWDDLKWGETRTLPFPTDAEIVGYHVVLEALNGLRYEYNGAMNNNSYFAITQQAFGVLIRVKPISELIHLV